MAAVVGFAALLAAVSLLVAWFVAREVHAATRRRDWPTQRRVAATAGAFVACSVAVFYAAVGALVAVLG